MKHSIETLGVNFQGFFTIFKILKKWNKQSPKSMIFWLIACLVWPGNRISGQKAILEPKNKVNWKIRSKLWVSKLRCLLQFSIFWKNWEKKRKSMIFRPIACLIWSGSRISGQKAVPGTKNKKMKKTEQTLGHINKSWKFQNFILVPGVQKNDVYDFSGFFYEKMGRKSGNHEWNDLGITSETTWYIGGTMMLRRESVSYTHLTLPTKA